MDEDPSRSEDFTRSRIPAEPDPWYTPLLIGFVTWLVFAGLGSAIIVIDHGFRELANKSYLVVVASALGVCLAFGFFFHLTSATRKKVDRMETDRRQSRAGLPRDLTILASATSSDRRSWFKRTRRLARLFMVRYAVLAIPAVAVLCLGVGEFLASFLPNSVVVIWLVGVVVASLVLVVKNVRADLRDPLLLVGRIRSGAYFDEVDPAEPPEGDDVAFQWIQHGHGRTISVDVTAACRLRSDGSLSSEPTWRGRKEVPVRRGLRQDLIEAERSVLLCSGSGAALYRLQRLAVGSTD